MKKLTWKQEDSEQGYRNVAIDEQGNAVATSRWYRSLAIANRQSHGFMQKARAAETARDLAELSKYDWMKMAEAEKRLTTAQILMRGGE